MVLPTRNNGLVEEQGPAQRPSNGPQARASPPNCRTPSRHIPSSSRSIAGKSTPTTFPSRAMVRPSTTTSRTSEALPRVHESCSGSTAMMASRSKRSRWRVTKSAAPGASSPGPGPRAAWPLRMARPGIRGPVRSKPSRHGRLRKELADHVTVLVKRGPVDADRDGAAASARGVIGRGRNAGARSIARQ